MEEDAFLRAILEKPNDSAPHLIYADWLDERQDETSARKAEFLRTIVEPAGSLTRRHRKARRRRLQQLAGDLDTSWLAVVSRMPIENCKGERLRSESEERTRVLRIVSFDFVCSRQWDELQPRDERDLRFCDQCNESVHYCDTIMAAREHAQAGHCIAVDLGIIRRPDDLSPQRMWLGRPSPQVVRAEEERMLPDPVSAKRERLKKETTAAEVAGR